MKKTIVALILISAFITFSQKANSEINKPSPNTRSPGISTRFSGVWKVTITDGETDVNSNGVITQGCDPATNTLFPPRTTRRKIKFLFCSKDSELAGTTLGMVFGVVLPEGKTLGSANIVSANPYEFNKVLLELVEKKEEEHNLFLKQTKQIQ